MTATSERSAPREEALRNGPDRAARRRGARDVVAAVAELIRTSAPGWVGGVLAGVQAALFSYALVLIPVWVMATSASDARVQWGESGGLAARVWLTGFGVPWAVNGTPVTLIPLGIPLVTVLMITQLSRRFASSTWAAGAATVLGFVASVGVMAALAWSGAPLVGERVLRAIAVAGALAIPATVWGLLRRHGATLAWLATLPWWFRSAARTALGLVSAVLASASLIAAGSAIAHRHDMGDAASALGIDLAGGTALAAIETLYAPNLVAWIVAWLSGAGYGAHGSLSGPGGGVSGLPGLPIVRAMPVGGGASVWVPLVLVASGALVAWITVPRLPRGIWALVTMLGAVAVSGGAIAALVRVSAGAMGPGSLANVGAPVVLTGVLSAAWLGLGVTGAWAVRRLTQPRGVTARSTTIQTSR